MMQIGIMRMFVPHGRMAVPVGVWFNHLTLVDVIVVRIMHVGVLMLQFIVHDFPAAVRWLVQEFNLPSHDFTPDARRDWARRRALAEDRARRVIGWRDGIVSELRCRHRTQFRLYHKAVRMVLALGLDHPMAQFWADVAESAERRWQAYEREIDQWLKLSPDNLCQFFDAGKVAA